MHPPASLGFYLVILNQSDRCFIEQEVTHLPIRVYLGNPWLKNDPFGTE
jgi:hypothetical protein